MGAAEMRVIANLIARVLAAPDDAAVAATVKAEVETLCQTFPLYRKPSASSTR
jgi:glycine/serine hydroxymethyltransferase